MGWLIDTCLWVDMERKRIVPADLQRYTGSDALLVSPVTIAEFSIGVETAEDPDTRATRQAALRRLRKEPYLVIDDDTALAFGTLAGRLRREGRLREHRIQDLWIASQAIQHGFQLLTRNGKDFEDLPGLQLVVFKDAAEPTAGDA